MSLGLGDLKKKKSSATTTTRVVKSVDVESSKSATARPWSASGLGNVAMSDETPHLQAAPLFYLELAGDSRLAHVEEVLVKIEERVTRALEGPLKAAQLFFPKFFAQ